MEIVVRGHHLPGTWFRSAGVPIHHVHVALQVGKDPEGLVPGDASTAEWRTEVRVEPLEGGGHEFRGPAVHGPRGERFLYLTWGDLGRDGTFDMFRRAKLMLGDIEPALVTEASTSAIPLVADVQLTDGRGGPTCGRVRPPTIQWSLAPTPT